MHKITCLLLLVGILFSCGTETDLLNVSKFTLNFGNGDIVLNVEANGDVFIDEKLVLKIKREGTIINKEGVVILKLINENEFLLGNDTTLPIEVAKNGTFTYDRDSVFKWSSTGELLKNGEKIGVKMTPVNKASFQTASLLFYLHFSF